MKRKAIESDAKGREDDVSKMEVELTEDETRDSGDNDSERNSSEGLPELPKLGLEPARKVGERGELEGSKGWCRKKRLELTWRTGVGVLTTSEATFLASSITGGVAYDLRIDPARRAEGEEDEEAKERGRATERTAARHRRG
jgi:hypothetical protein